MAYTTSALVIKWLGSNYDSTNDLTGAEVTAFIVVADGIIDERVSPHYNLFNATDSSKSDGTDTYKTPNVVATASRHLAAAMCFDQLRALAANETLESRAEYHNNVGSQLVTDQAFLAATSPLDSGDPPHIIKESVRISSASTVAAGQTFTAAEAANMRNGVDFEVDWAEKYGKWVFHSLNSNITDMTTVKVTWLWDYRRKFGDEAKCSGVLRSGW
jgi:hypothetical protein